MHREDLSPKGGVRNRFPHALGKVIGDAESNCFMIDTGRPGNSVIAAMQAKNAYIGRTWPVWPNAVRVTIGSPDAMDQVQGGFQGGHELARRCGIHGSPGDVADPMSFAHFA